MNRRPRRSQRKAPPLRGRAATLSTLNQTSLNQSIFTPLSVRPITRQSPPRPSPRSDNRLGRRLGQPAPGVHDNTCYESPTHQHPIWGNWIKLWGWFIALALVIMAIAIGLQH